MIHHVEDWMFDLPLENFILTFDDGYRDHWDTFPRFLEIPTDKIYFVTGAWIDRTDFLTVPQIQQMAAHKDVTIGAHGFDHQRIISLDGRSVPARSAEEIVSFIENDTRKTVAWFEQNFGQVPTKFCFPYNDPVHGIYTQILKQYGFNEFYGPERIDIYWMRDPEWVKSNQIWLF